MSEDVHDARNRADGAGRRDSEAVARALQGDADAFDELVRRYQRRSVALAYRLVGDGHAAADIAQDAFVRAYRRLASLNDPERFGPWLLRIVSNLSLNYRRSRRARSTVPLEPVTESSEGFRRASDSTRLTSSAPSADADAADLAAAIERALLRLPDKQRTALTLFSIEGIPQKEVAEMMDCSVELVKWNVFQARKAMRKILAGFME